MMEDTLLLSLKIADLQSLHCQEIGSPNLTLSSHTTTYGQKDKSHYCFIRLVCLFHFFSQLHTQGLFLKYSNPSLNLCNSSLCISIYTI